MTHTHTPFVLGSLAQHTRYIDICAHTAPQTHSDHLICSHATVECAYQSHTVVIGLHTLKTHTQIDTNNNRHRHHHIFLSFGCLFVCRFFLCCCCCCNICLQTQWTVALVHCLSVSCMQCTRTVHTHTHTVNCISHV